MSPGRPLSPGRQHAYLQPLLPVPPPAPPVQGARTPGCSPCWWPWRRRVRALPAVTPLPIGESPKPQSPRLGIRLVLLAWGSRGAPPTPMCPAGTRAERRPELSSPPSGAPLEVGNPEPLVCRGTCRGRGLRSCPPSLQPEVGREDPRLVAKQGARSLMLPQRDAEAARDLRRPLGNPSKRGRPVPVGILPLQPASGSSCLQIPPTPDCV